jgi:hypothetical protein
MKTDKEDSIGDVMEGMVQRSLLRKPVIRYFYYDAATNKTLVESALSLADMEGDIIEVADKTLDKVLDLSKKQCAYFIPNAKSFDFVFFDGQGKSHAIQVSKTSWQTKCRTTPAFFKETKPHYKYLLTIQEPDTIALDKLQSSYFKTALIEHNLRLMHPDFINTEHLEQFRKM